jgi:hypothetical protein
MMRYNNQLTVKNLANSNSSRMGENCDNSSEISDSMESVIETNNNNSTMSDSFSWNFNKPDHLGLTKITKSFAVLCEPESENNENRDFKSTVAAPTSRWVVKFYVICFFSAIEKEEEKNETRAEHWARFFIDLTTFWGTQKKTTKLYVFFSLSQMAKRPLMRRQPNNNHFPFLFYHSRQIKYKYVKHHQELRRKKRNKYGESFFVFGF